MTDTAPPDLSGCFDAPDELTRLSLARQHVVDTCTSISNRQTIDVAHSLGHVLAEDVRSDVDIPAADNSAMDGYAIDGNELKSELTGGRSATDLSLRVIGEAFAGHPFTSSVNAGEAVKIMTGAYLPSGTDTVIAQEHATCENGEQLVIGAGHRVGQNVRSAGEDVCTGSIVLSEGQRIGDAEIGVLSSIGRSTISVYRRPRIAIFSTGDELVEAGSAIAFGQIFDCNRPLLKSLLASSGCDVVDLGILKDNPKTVGTALADAADQVDAIVTSGGISTGDADHVSDCVQQLGELGVWRIALRPGRPFAYGRIGETRFFGLPGNPIAVMVTYYMLVVPALRRIAGDLQPWQPHHFKVRSPQSIRKKPDRTELYRAVLSQNDETGELVVNTTGNQGSGLLTSMSRANCFVVLDHDDETTEADALVPVLPFSALI